MKKVNSIDIHTSKAGDKVFFGFPTSGYDFDQRLAAQNLVLGKEYTISRLDIHAWNTDIYLKEIKGISFNSVLFSVENPNPSVFETCLYKVRTMFLPQITKIQQSYRKLKWNLTSLFKEV